MSFNIGQIHFSASLPVFLFGAAALLVVAVLCVAAVRRSVRPRHTGVLETLRFLAAMVAVLLLWQPEWRTTVDPARRPEIVILWDASESMQSADAEVPESLGAPGEIVTRRDLVDRIIDTRFWAPLEASDRHRVSVVPFSPVPETDDPAALAVAGTDINAALDDLLENRPDLRAVVLLSDGDWNTGERPVAAAQKMRLRDIPIFALPAGSPTRLPDLDLKNVSAPTYGIVGENVQIPFTIVSSLDRDVRTVARLRDESGRERTKDITIPAQSPYYDAILWRLEDEGSTTLDLSIPFAEGERVDKNNSRRFTIAGRPESIRVLVIETLPRWEYRYIRNALSRDPGVDVDCLLFHPQLGAGDGPDYIQSFPEKLEDLQKYDVVFLGDVGVGPDQLTSKQAALLKGLVENQASGIVFIPGPMGNQFSLLDTELGALIPVALDENKTSGHTGSTASPLELTSEGRGSLLTMLGDTEEDNPIIWRSLPGFYWHAPVERAKSGTEVLAVHANRRHPKYGQRIPLLVTSRAGNGKVLFMGIDSAWRWRRGVEDLYHYRFWGQVARWMSYQRNMAAGQRIRLYFTPERPSPGDVVTLNANAFEESGAPLEDGAVLVDLTAPDGVVKRFELAPSDAAWGSFAGRFRITMPGPWKLRATTSGSARGAVQATLLAQGVKLEKTGHPARPDVLAELAGISRGQILSPGRLGVLTEQILTLPKARPQVVPIRLWSQWIVAASLVALLSVFWIGRKLNGTF